MQFSYIYHKNTTKYSQANKQEERKLTSLLVRATRWYTYNLRILWLMKKQENENLVTYKLFATTIQSMWLVLTNGQAEVR